MCPQELGSIRVPPRLAGLGVAGVGLSHFVSPQMFDGLTKAGVSAKHHGSTSTSTVASRPRSAWD